MRVWRDWMLSARWAWHRLTHRDEARIRRVVRRLKQVKGKSYEQLTDMEQAWLDQIRLETRHHNCNNVTRTRAYLDYYRHHREIQWALLAHMVSRNGGWSMTDLRGEWYPRIASHHDAKRFFTLLERSNWLIFGDAYPQLLLYEQGMQSKRRWTHLLPHLGVSIFMQAMWEDFMETQDAELLTHALIINEQNFIEARVIQNQKYSQDVLDSMQYIVQSVLNLNHVILPYRVGSDVKLKGTTVKQFTSLDHRIETGKRLYRLLFRDKLQHQRALAWMEGVVHTGSRSDIWPHLFTPQKSGPIEAPYQPKLVGNREPGARIYSPRLEDVWPDVQQEDAEQGDWYRDNSCLPHLFERISVSQGDFTETYVNGLRTIEKILQAQDKLASVVPSARSER